MGRQTTDHRRQTFNHKGFPFATFDLLQTLWSAVRGQLSLFKNNIPNLSNEILQF